MRKIAALLLLLALLPACALIQRKVEIIPWPSEVSFLDGEGDLDIRSPKERFSGSFTCRMAYPHMLFFEAYGPFGQTLLHLRKDGEKFLLIAGGEKTADETVLLDRFGFTVKEFMHDLALRGDKRETPGGLVAQGRGYQIVYGHDRRGRRTMCWERQDGRLCLAFSEISFADH
jgi:hypothetical protein